MKTALLDITAHIDYTDPGLFYKHFKLAGRGGLGHTRIYVSKDLGKRPGSV